MTMHHDDGGDDDDDDDDYDYDDDDDDAVSGDCKWQRKTNKQCKSMAA